MKTFKNITILCLLFIAGVYTGCKKDPVMYGKGFESFKFIVKDALDADKEYEGLINGDEVVVQLPIEVDVTNLKASFTMDNPRTIVQVGSEVQESGITEQDFTNPVSYRVKAEDKSTRSYSVRVEKKIALQSFGFYADDNTGLLSNYSGVIKGLNINVMVPETINLTTLVARFETTNGAALKVAGIQQESKKSINNFSNPVVYTFTQPGLTGSVDYTVTISFMGRKWSLFADKITGKSTASGIKIAIDPFTNHPYFVYQRTGKDDAGIDIPTDNRKIAVMGYNGSDFVNIGDKTGISEFRADVAGIAFSNEGILYAAYKDYFNAEQKATVLKYNGASWSVFGNSRFTPLKIDYLSIAFTKNDQPILGMMRTSAADNINNPPVAARGLYATMFDGGLWKNTTPTGNVTVAYQQTIKGLDNNIYIGAMDRTTGSNKLSMFKYNNGIWDSVGPRSFTAPDGLAGFLSVSIAVDKNGEAYLAYQAAPASGRINHVMKFNKTTATWQELGNAVSSGGERDKFALTVDQDGILYFAYATPSSLSVRTFNPATNNWNNDRKVISEKINEFDIQVASDGTIYIVASIAGDNRTVVYKYTK